MLKAKFNKRIFIIGSLHLAFSFTILIIALLLLAANVDNYQEYTHPLPFLILQWIANLPLVMPIMTVAGQITLILMLKGIETPSLYITIAAGILAMPFNSYVWGFTIDKIITFLSKRKEQFKQEG